MKLIQLLTDTAKVKALRLKASFIDISGVAADLYLKIYHHFRV